jgi:hypothetical protein
MSLPSNFDSLSPAEQIAFLKADNASLSQAQANKSTVAKGQPSIKDGIVRFARVGGLYGVSLNPESFKAIRAHFQEACRLYDSVGDARMVEDYNKRPAYVPKSNNSR